MCKKDFLVEGLEDDLNLLLEQLAIGIGVPHRRTEGLDLARVIATPDPEYRSSFGQDVGHSEILGQAQGMPHRGNVKFAADAQPLRHMRQVHCQHQDIGYAFIALVLEMVLGEPECVEAQRIHLLGDGLRLLEHGGQLFIGISALVGRRRVLTHVRKINVARVDGNKLGNHLFCFQRALS